MYYNTHYTYTNMRIVLINLDIADKLCIYIGPEVWATSTFAIKTTEGLLMEIEACDRLLSEAIDGMPEWHQENIEKSVRTLRRDCKYYDDTLLSVAARFTISDDQG